MFTYFLGTAWSPLPRGFAEEAVALLPSPPSPRSRFLPGIPCTEGTRVTVGLGPLGLREISPTPLLSEITKQTEETVSELLLIKNPSSRSARHRSVVNESNWEP